MLLYLLYFVEENSVNLDTREVDIIQNLLAEGRVRFVSCTTDTLLRYVILLRSI